MFLSTCWYDSDKILKVLTIFFDGFGMSTSKINAIQNIRAVYLKERSHKPKSRKHKAPFRGKLWRFHNNLIITPVLIGEISKVFRSRVWLVPFSILSVVDLEGIQHLRRRIREVIQTSQFNDCQWLVALLLKFCIPSRSACDYTRIDKQLLYA